VEARIWYYGGVIVGVLGTMLLADPIALIIWALFFVLLEVTIWFIRNRKAKKSSEV